MLVIYFQQLREHFSSLRVQISLIVVAIFFILNGSLSSMRILDMRESDQLIYAQIEERYDRIEVVADAAGGYYRTLNEPTGTEFMSEGGFNWFWGSVWVSAETASYPFYYYGRDVNLWMDRFENLDWTLIVRLVLSFLCIVLAYDGIAGESERGTLRLVLAYPISRIRLLLAKYAASLTILLIAFLLGSLLSLMILSVTGAITLSAGLLAKYILYGGVVGIYLSLFLLLSLAVSSLTRSSVSSLVLLTLVWAVFNVVLPQSSYLVAMRTLDIPWNWADPIFDYRNDVREAIDAPRSFELAQSDNFTTERTYARAMNDAENQMYRMGAEGLDRKLHRYQIARTINLISPSFAFQYTVEAVLGTGLAKRQNFLEQALDYRESLRHLIREQDALDPDSPHILYLSNFLSKAPLSEGQLPRFVERPLSAADGLAFSVTPLIVLLLETAAAFFFALWAVNRADVTGYAVAEES